MPSPLGRRSLLAFLAGGLASLAAPVRAALFPADGAWDFLVETPDGEVLGRQSYRFSRAEARFYARLEADYLLPAGQAPPQAFRLRSEETWTEGWLTEVVTDARHGERRWRLRAERRDDTFAGLRNGQAFTASGYLIPSSLWHPDTPLVESLFDVLEGRLRVVRGYRLGSERVEVGPAARSAIRWRLEGELPAELWYDEERSLVRALLPVAGGPPLLLRR